MLQKILKRIHEFSVPSLSSRQIQLFNFVKERRSITTSAAALFLGISSDTVLNEIKILIKQNLIEKTGVGKNTRYQIIT